MAIRNEDLVYEAIVLPFPAPMEGDRMDDRRERNRATRRARMLRRRRRSAVVGTAAFVFAATILGGGGEAVAPASSPGAPTHVVVGPGETLWGLAERFVPPGIDTRAYVDAVVDLNELQGGLEAGRRIELPK